jgi:hypothetical protein
MINVLLNLCLVSIPESTIWTVATLILLRRFDLLDKYRLKKNIKYLIIPILSSSLSVIILRYIINAPRLIVSLSAVITIYIGIIIVLKITNIAHEKIPYIKTFMLVIFNLAILIIFVESLYAPFLITYIKKSIIEVNDIGR